MGKMKKGKEWTQCLSLTVVDIYCVSLSQRSGGTKQYSTQSYLLHQNMYFSFKNLWIN